MLETLNEKKNHLNEEFLVKVMESRDGMSSERAIHFCDGSRR